MSFDCDPQANLDEPTVCLACGDDGRAECEACGGEEPTIREMSEGAIIVALYDQGAIYDRRRSGSDRSMHLFFNHGEWVCQWRNGPHDTHRVTTSGSTPMFVIKWLLVSLCEINRKDDRELAAE